MKYLFNVGNVTDCQSRNFEAKWCLSSFHINQVMSVWCGYYQKKKRKKALPEMLYQKCLVYEDKISNDSEKKKKLRIKTLQLINSIQFL